MFLLDDGAITFEVPQADFLCCPDCYQKCQDWVEECELLLNGPLASKSKEIKESYVLIWAGKFGRRHIKLLNLSAEQKQRSENSLTEVPRLDKVEV